MLDKRGLEASIDVVLTFISDDVFLFRLLFTKIVMSPLLAFLFFSCVSCNNDTKCSLSAECRASHYVIAKYLLNECITGTAALF